MQVVCHNNKYTDGDTVEGLTLNKIYYNRRVFGYDEIEIVDDNGKTRFFVLKDFFTSIDQWRDKQIDKLLE
jgi:hypothetical protein